MFFSSILFDAYCLKIVSTVSLGQNVWKDTTPLYLLSSYTPNSYGLSSVPSPLVIFIPGFRVKHGRRPLEKL